MKKITTVAALLSAIGSGAALAQGAPPGFAWHSGWPSHIQSQQVFAMNARKATTTRPDSRTEVTRNAGSFPTWATPRAITSETSGQM